MSPPPLLIIEDSDIGFDSFYGTPFFIYPLDGKTGILLMQGRLEIISVNQFIDDSFPVINPFSYDGRRDAEKIGSPVMTEGSFMSESNALYSLDRCSISGEIDREDLETITRTAGQEGQGHKKDIFFSATRSSAFILNIVKQQENY